LNEGSSVGVYIVDEASEPLPFKDSAWPFGPKVMVERFIPGKEITVAVMDDRALAVTEITTDRGFYDYKAKYDKGGSVHLLPAPLGEAAYREAMDLAVRAHRTLGCRGVSRADMRYDGETFYLLEINTQPGMTETSLVPEQAAHAGISFNELVSWMVENAEYDR
jgi:D-alanine-D-alanine ligase